ncbi:MAG: hybrid sensor histidine kinase/response regulator [Dehalogenimonas sp.]
MAKLLKDRFFWYVTTLVLLIGLMLIYDSVTARSSADEWSQFLIPAQRMAFVIAIAVASWRFGAKTGWLVCLIVGLSLLARHLFLGINDFPQPSVSNIFVESVFVSLGFVFSWFIDKYHEETKKLVRSEQDLKHAAEEWRATFDSILDMVSIQDKNCRLLRVNQAYANALGMIPKEVIGKKCHEIIHGTIGPVPECPHKITMETGKPQSFELYDASKGTYSEVLTYPIFDGKGEVTSTVHIIRDISRRKKSEAELQQLRDKTESFSRLAAVGEMAAGIAHEINNPLTGVIGFSELLKDRKDLPEDVVQSLQIINSGSTRVKEIVKRMLTFARQSKPEKTSTSITELIENTLELRSYVLSTSNIVVVRYYAHDLPWVTVDAGQLQQVFLNLIVNAEYAMKRAHDKGILTIKTERLDGHIRISITDDGPGMSNEIKTKLFRPFFTTKDPGEGTGLGLAISFGIIQEHSGTIEVESELGQGTTFIIELPITASKEEPQTKDPVVVDTSQKVKPANILVVDDEPTIRALIKSILGKQGHTVEETDDPQQALEMIGKTTYDLIFMDIRMPGMSGMELHKKISDQGPEQAGRIVFITGDTSDLTIRKYLEGHRIPYITKPFDLTTLEGKANEILGGNDFPGI